MAWQPPSSPSNANSCSTCRQWTRKRILSSSETQEKTDKLILFLKFPKPKANLNNENFTTFPSSLSSCCLTSRVKAAFLILNGVRDGCRHHLSLATALSLNQQESRATTYKDSFPSLQESTNAPTAHGKKKNTPRTPPHQQHQQKNQKKKRDDAPKRRIRPAKTSPSASIPLKGNISSLPSEDPIEMRRMLSVRRENQALRTGGGKAGSWKKDPVFQKVSHVDDKHHLRKEREPGTKKRVNCNTKSSTVHVHREMIKGCESTGNTNMKTDNGLEPTVNKISMTASSDSYQQKIKGCNTNSKKNTKEESFNASNNDSAKNFHDTMTETNAVKSTKGEIYSMTETIENQNFNMRCDAPSINAPSSTSTNQTINNAERIESSESTETGNAVETNTNINKNSKITSKATSTGNQNQTSKTTVSEKKVTHDLNENILSEYRHRLVQIYSTILFEHLAPSTILELHLLMRLLSVSSDPSDDKSDTQISTPNTISAFKPLFSSPEGCHTFATLTLPLLDPILTSLHPSLLSALITFPPLQTHLPVLTSKLKITLSNSNHQLLSSTTQIQSAMPFSTCSQPILFLPFNPRDSRHNYRTTEQQSLFQNREGVRDLFLSQLRENPQNRINFDMKLMEKNARRILNLVKEKNLIWFCELFCELLLQVGMVAMMETDVEVLKCVEDVGKLQKLHKRFTVKNDNNNNNTNEEKIFLSTSNQSSSLETQPRDYFTGHEEYFYLFLESVDSHRLNVQLMHCLHREIFNLSSSESGALAQRLAKQKLLAKFLGLLAFGPNWNLTEEEGQETISCWSLVNVLIPIKEYIEVAWKERRLIGVMPWICEYLNMMKWDTISIKSEYYRHVFGMLRSIQRKISPGEGYYNSNMQIIFLELESLFENVTNLETAECLPLISLPECNSENLDTLPIWFPETFLYESCPYLEDLNKLLRIPEKRPQRGGASKKMRPHRLSSTDVITTEDAWKNLNSTDEGNNFTQSTKSQHNTIITKLTDAFFHQHSDLQKLAEFVISTTVKNTCTLISSECIFPIVQNHLSTYNLSDPKSYQQALSEISSTTIKAATSFMKQRCEEYIPSAMRILSPPSEKQVQDIAINLAIRHACLESVVLVESLVKAEVQKQLDVCLKNGVKCETKKSEGERKVAQGENDLERCLVALTSFFQRTYQVSEKWRQQVPKSIHMMNVSKIVPWNIAGDNRFKSEEFKTLVETFAESLTSILQKWLLESHPTSREFLHVISNGVMIGIELGKMKWSGSLRRIGCLLCEPMHLKTLMTCEQRKKFVLIFCEEHTNDKKERMYTLGMGEMLMALVEGELISTAELERSILRIMSDAEKADDIADYCLERLNKGDGCKDEWVNENAIVMSRLCKVVKRKKRTLISSKSVKNA